MSVGSLATQGYLVQSPYTEPGLHLSLPLRDSASPTPLGSVIMTLMLALPGRIPSFVSGTQFSKASKSGLWKRLCFSSVNLGYLFRLADISMVFY